MACGGRASLRTCGRPSPRGCGRDQPSPRTCGVLLTIGRRCDSGTRWNSRDSQPPRCQCCDGGRLTKWLTFTFFVTLVTLLTTTTRCECHTGRVQKNPLLTKKVGHGAQATG